MAVPASADFVTIPVKNNAVGAPIAITQTSVFIPSDQQSFRACVSFRNTTTKNVNFINFTFRFNDQLGEALREAVLPRSGSFGPGVNIEGKMTLLGGNSDSFNNCVSMPMTNIQPPLEIVDVTEVRFDDGSVWKKGDPPVGAVAVRPAGAPGGGSNGSSVNVGDAHGQGGSFATVAGTFGAIAWIPGSRKVVGTAIDAQTQTDADYQALYSCNQLNGGGTNCKVVVRMYGDKYRCGAISLDESAGKFGSARGPNINDTIKAALDALQAEGGTLGANSIATTACNTH